MPWNQNCNQGRNCNCDRGADRATIFVIVLTLICIASIGLGAYKLLKGNKGQECAVEVQFKDSKATYIGHSV